MAVYVGSTSSYPLGDMEDPLFEEVGNIVKESEDKSKESEKEYLRLCCLTDELLRRDNEMTPDWLKLKLQYEIPVFVYDGLRPGGPWKDLLSDCKTLGEGYTALESYILRSVGGNYPAACRPKIGQDNMKARIYGDVFIVPPEKMLQLDLMERNTKMFQREQHWIFLIDQSLKTRGGQMYPSVKCWMYIAIPNWIDQTATSICSTKEGSEKLKKYYEWEHPTKVTTPARMATLWPEGRPGYVSENSLLHRYHETRQGPLAANGVMTS